MAMKMGDPHMITELTAQGLVTRPMTSRDKRAAAASRAHRARQDREEEAARATAKAWLASFEEQIGLTEADRRDLPGCPDIVKLVKSLGWRTGEDQARFEWLMRQKLLIDWELRARYWRISKRLRAKILAAGAVYAGKGAP